jgi:hypothetical protein
MRRISFRDNGEEHNFWQNYTDLMSGFLIVFIISSLVAYGSYKVYVDLYHNKGITEANIHDIVVNAELYNKIREFQDAQKSINRKYFKYNDKYQRFECTVKVIFAPESSDIPNGAYSELISAGKEIEEIIAKFKESTNVSFKVVIEGRAARSHNNPNPNPSQKANAARLSYERARNLHLFWKSKGLLSTIEKQNGEVFISGSGFEGKGRYSGRGPKGEDLNKTFIIQIIPYITY